MISTKYNFEMTQKSCVQSSEIKEGDFVRIQKAYADACFEKTKLDCGMPLTGDSTADQVKMNYEKAVSDYEQMNELKAKLKQEREFAQKAPVQKRDKNDFSKATMADYNELTDVIEKYECFKGMMNNINEQIITRLEEKMKGKKITQQPIVIRDTKFPTNCDYRKASMKMMGRSQFAIFLGSNVVLESQSVKNEMPSTIEDWDNEFQQMNSIADSLIRFGDYCKAYDKNLSIFCANKKQVDFLKSHQQTFSFFVVGSKSTLEITSAFTNQHAMFTQPKRLTCVILIGNAKTQAPSTIEKLIKNDFAMIELSDKPLDRSKVNGLIMYVDVQNQGQGVDADQSGASGLIQEYFAHCSGRVIAQLQTNPKSTLNMPNQLIH